MIISYGTKKYYETELAKAKFTETAIKRHVKDCLAEGKNADDAEVLQCYSELIENATAATERAQKFYDEFVRQEEQKEEEQNNG